MYLVPVHRVYDVDALCTECVVGRFKAFGNSQRMQADPLDPLEMVSTTAAPTPFFTLGQDDGC